MRQGLEGQAAIVTGGTGGLGRHVVPVLLEEGVVVHVPWVDEAELAQVRSDLEGVAERVGGVVRFHHADVTDPAAVDALVTAVSRESGPVRILCNLAGGFALHPLEETAPATWDRMMELNARTAFLTSRAVAPGMAEAGGGRIVNVAAHPAVERGQPLLSAYSPSKAAVMNLTETLSKELVDRGITVNAVLPSIIDTPGNREAMPAADRSTWLPPEEIAGVIRFLVGPHARTVTGAAVTLSLG